MAFIRDQDLAHAAEKACKVLNISSENDLRFIHNNYLKGNFSRFRKRIHNLSMIGRNNVLDLGCGFGQWSFVLSEMNSHVYATDPNAKRVEFCNFIQNELGIKNIEFSTKSIESINKPEYFDAIFMYSVLPWTPWRKTLERVSNMLCEQGLFYFNANDLGWLLKNIIERPTVTSDFDSEKWALRSICLTEEYESTGNFEPREHLDGVYIRQDLCREFLSQLPFEILSFTGEGQTSMNNLTTEPFFPSSAYGYPAVYESLCRKSVNKLF